RRQLDVIYERALACYGEACLGIGGTELPAAERAARRLLAHTPLAETGHRLLMRALTARGGPVAAPAVHRQPRRPPPRGLGGPPAAAPQGRHVRRVRGQPLDEPARPATRAR